MALFKIRPSWERLCEEDVREIDEKTLHVLVLAGPGYKLYYELWEDREGEKPRKLCDMTFSEAELWRAETKVMNQRNVRLA